ncbi:hypothetical protein CEXT_451401 [Caerostris extrusa]|uniref:Uncharacterized protein n=1 Tax=Caerostris extrusa TaxID=172846 RepID=A0AAV4Y746_CAEEX|nr:hypothetical protein CEXT_451401 [Caerostris extrusa]
MEINTIKPSPEKTIKTGKRGRPRKYPKPEENVPVKQSEPVPLHSDIKSDEINASPGKTYSRREDSCVNGNSETLMKQTLKRKITCDDGSHNKKASSVSGITLQGTISSKKKEFLSFVSDVENLCDYHEDIYPALKPDLDNFQILPSQYTKCLQASIHIKIDNSLKWTKLKCFDSISLDG